MNYQGNIDAYYKYANENRKVGHMRRKSIYRWLLLFIVIGFLIWCYLNYFNMAKIENLDALAFSNGSHKVLVQKEERSEKNQTLSLSTTNTKAEKAISTENEINGTMPKPEEVASSTMDANSSLQIGSVLITSAEVIDANHSITMNGNVAEQNQTVEATSDKVAGEEIKIEGPLYNLYVVSRGESLSDIAKKQYNDVSMYVELIKANPDFENPNEIKEGDEILLPIVDEGKSYSQILHFK